VAGSSQPFVDLSGRRGGHFRGNGAASGLADALDDGKGARRDSGYDPSPLAIVNHGVRPGSARAMWPRPLSLHPISNRW